MLLPPLLAPKTGSKRWSHTSMAHISGLQELAGAVRQRLRHTLLAAHGLEAQGQRRQEARGGGLGCDPRRQRQGIEPLQELASQHLARLKE